MPENTPRLTTAARPGLLILLAGLACSGCAYRYTDAHGSEHVIGLVRVTLPPDAEDAADATGRSVTLENLGVLVGRAGTLTGLSVGYSRETMYFVRDDSAAHFEPEQKD